MKYHDFYQINFQETFDDYLEMFIQFGYVFLFSAVYPLAAFWAIVNNVLEIRADAFKLCKVFQKPSPKRVKDIGAWQVKLTKINVKAWRLQSAIITSAETYIIKFIVVIVSVNITDCIRSDGWDSRNDELCLVKSIAKHTCLGPKYETCRVAPVICGP